MSHPEALNDSQKQGNKISAPYLLSVYFHAGAWEVMSSLFLKDLSYSTSTLFAAALSELFS